jgi:putative FmdB family regulatory protein
MPIYEYRCEPCRHRFEAFLASSSEQAVCPKCASTQLSRLMSTFAASVPGGYKATQAAVPNPSSGPQGGGSGPTSAPKAGGCGGGCACH